MTLLRVYIWNHKVVMPNVVQTADGFFVDEGPVEVFELAKTNTWANFLTKRLRSGNKMVATPDGSEEPGSAILERLNIVKWSTFEVQALMYTVHLGARYVSIYRTGKGPDGMWLGSATEQRQFDPRVPLQTLADELVKEIITVNNRRPPGTGLAVIQKDS